ncbi:MAG: nuclear transport factor 2 family protein [Acidimicrobiia bacterium]
MGLLFRPRPRLMKLAAGAPGAPNAEARAETLRRALEAGIRGETATLPDLYTADVKGWSPTTSIETIAELASELAGRAGVFSEVEVVADLEVVDDTGYAEWVVTARHTGPLVVDDEMVIGATGRSVTMRGVTVAEFCDDRICSFRQYWDEPAMLEALGVLPRD